MAWIELHQSLRTHAKVGRLASLASIPDPDLARAKLENLWLWALDNCLSGKLTVAERPVSAAEVSFASGWNGDPEIWLRSLIDAGWIDFGRGGKNGKTMQLHDWHDYAGRLIESRKADAKRKREKRLAARPPDVHLDGDSTVPNRTLPNQRTVPPPLSAPPGTPDHDREVDKTVGAFGFCNTPGIPAKQNAIRDLLRLGLTHEEIRVVAHKQERKTFLEILRSLEKGRKPPPEHKPTTRKPKRCALCDDRREVPDRDKSTPEKTVFKTCPDCGTKATG